MTELTFREIFAYCKNLHQQDREIQRTFNAFIEVIAEKEYPPYLSSRLDTVLQRIQIEHPWLSMELSYFFYEAMRMSEAICSYKEKKYNLKNENEFFEWIHDQYFSE